MDQGPPKEKAECSWDKKSQNQGHPLFSAKKARTISLAISALGVYNRNLKMTWQASNVASLRKNLEIAKGDVFMLVRNVNDPEVLETTYLAHGGAIAQMILDRRSLKELGFLAIARLERGKTIERHTDPMEEIYFVLSGEGDMSVDDECKHVTPGDATWIPAGSSHSLTNSEEEDLLILVVASSNW